MIFGNMNDKLQTAPVHTDTHSQSTAWWNSGFRHHWNCHFVQWYISSLLLVTVSSHDFCGVIWPKPCPAVKRRTIWCPIDGINAIEQWNNGYDILFILISYSVFVDFFNASLDVCFVIVNSNVVRQVLVMFSKGCIFRRCILVSKCIEKTKFVT